MIIPRKNVFVLEDEREIGENVKNAKKIEREKIFYGIAKNSSYSVRSIYHVISYHREGIRVVHSLQIFSDVEREGGTGYLTSQKHCIFCTAEWFVPDLSRLGRGNCHRYLTPEE